MTAEAYDVAVIGGGPAGATAAETLARTGRSVLLLDRAGRIKPCGGAIPPRLVRDFAIPEKLLVARIGSARIVSPSDRQVDMPIDGSFVGMVDRDVFDEWLRRRAEFSGARRETGVFRGLGRNGKGQAVVAYDGPGGERRSVAARIVVGADGANSAVARAAIPTARSAKFVFAYHEIVRAPAPSAEGRYDGRRCDVYYRGAISPDFYGWVFPHGATASVGVGSAEKGFGLREATARLRLAAGLDGAETLRREGAPIPLRPLRRFDNGRDVVLAGDAAGVVAPASGEGIYYAMESGRLAAEAAADCLDRTDPRALGDARRRFMRAHGRVFFILGLMQRFWYGSDAMRERFVSMCRDPDVQRLTWRAYTEKQLVRADPLAHLRIFVKDLAHLAGIGRP